MKCATTPPNFRQWQDAAQRQSPATAQRDTGSQGGGNTLQRPSMPFLARVLLFSQRANLARPHGLPQTVVLCNNATT
jgi:hypothetical protein